YRDHKARASDRRARVLLPDAAAGLGGSPEALVGRRADGLGYEPIRPLSRHHGASTDVAPGVRESVCRSLAGLLHLRPHGNHAAPRRGKRWWPRPARADDGLVPRVLRLREGASARRRLSQAEVPSRPPAGTGVGTAVDFLPALWPRDRRQ